MKCSARIGRGVWMMLVAAGLVLASASAARGQSPQEVALRELRGEIQRLREEVAALRDEMRRARQPAAPPATAEPSGAQAQAAQAQAALEMVQAQVAEHSQTKVESSTRLPVRIFGAILSSTYFNSGEANWLDNPNIADAAPSGGLPRGSFSSTLRQSRMGATIEGPQIGGLRARGFVAMDFFGGIPNFQTGPVIGLPRLLYAFLRLEGERTAFVAGQDHMIFAPANPTSLASFAFPGLYRSGNLYLRVPQLRVERNVAAGRNSEIQLAGGILAPVAGDFVGGAFEFVPPNLGGERSRQPGLQGRLGWRSRAGGIAESGGVEFGISGHTSSVRQTTDSTRSWGTAIDFDARWRKFGLGGEWFAGRALAAFGGSLGQAAKSAGGFVEARLRATPRLEFNAGYGIDSLFDLAATPAPLERNSSVFGNFIYQFTPELATSFEYRWLSTKPGAAQARRNSHLHLVFAYRF